MHDELFTEMTFHAAYEPQRAVRTDRWKYIRRFHDYEQPVLANCDDSETKELMIEAGWGGQYVPEEQLYDLVLDPERKPRPELGLRARATSLATCAPAVEAWMEETDDPLRHGPIEPPAGAIVNRQIELSPAERAPGDRPDRGDRSVR